MSMELKAQKGDTVSVHYIGRFPGGKVFDTSMEKEAKSAGIEDQVVVLEEGITKFF